MWMNASHHLVSIIACVRIKRTHSCATVPWDTLASCVKQVWAGCGEPYVQLYVCIIIMSLIQHQAAGTHHKMTEEMVTAN